MSQFMDYYDQVKDTLIFSDPAIKDSLKELIAKREKLCSDIKDVEVLMELEMAKTSIRCLNKECNKENKISDLVYTQILEYAPYISSSCREEVPYYKEAGGYTVCLECGEKIPLYRNQQNLWRLFPSIREEKRE